MSPWMQTASGRRFHFLQCTAGEIDIDDIAHALSNICRFNGHCRKFYSVAEHSIYVSQFVSSHLALDGLLHDAAEAYIGDVIHPQKDYIRDFRIIEDRIMVMVAARFGLIHEFHKRHAIKQVDRKLCYTEGSQIMPDIDDWEYKDTPYDLKIQCFTPRIAKSEFLSRFWSIYDDSEEITGYRK